MNASSRQRQTPPPPVAVRTLAPLGEDDATVEDTVVSCARAFAAAFLENPIEPTLSGIAAQAKCSRNTVRTHLAEAQRRGLLHLSVRLPHDAALSGELRRKYGLADAVVTPAPLDWEDQESVRRALSIESLTYFSRLCLAVAAARSPGSTLRVGMDGGRTLYQAVHEPGPFEFPRLRYELMPLVFGPLEGSPFAANVVTHVLATRLQTSGASAEVRNRFTIDPDWSRSSAPPGDVYFTVRASRGEIVSELDVVLVGIGSERAGLLHQEIGDRSRDHSSVTSHFGDILNLPFDAQGGEVPAIARTRAVLLSLDDLRALSTGKSALVVGVAGGKDKLEAIRTVLGCRYVSVLVTDLMTARRLLKS